MHIFYLVIALYHIQFEDLLKGLSFMFDMRPPKTKAKMWICLAKYWVNLVYLISDNEEFNRNIYRSDTQLLTGFPSQIMPLDKSKLGKQSSNTSLKAMNSYSTATATSPAGAQGQSIMSGSNPSACVSCQQVAQATAAQQCQMQHHHMEKHRRTPSSKLDWDIWELGKIMKSRPPSVLFPPRSDVRKDLYSCASALFPWPLPPCPF